MKTKWSKEEIDLMRRLYPSSTTCEDFQRTHMPYRTRNQVYHKANRLLLLRGKRWEEIKMFHHVSKEDLAYFAGILDGEGYIQVIPRWGLAIQITNTNKELVDWLQKVFGGGIGFRPSPKPRHKDQYCWNLTRKENVLSLLSLIRHLLIVKREKTEYLLEKYSFKEAANE